MGSFIEYSKDLIDQLNAWHSKQSAFKIDKFTKTVYSLHYYDSVVVIEKKPIQPPVSLTSGVLVGDPFAKKRKSIVTIAIRKIGRALNTLLQFLRLPSVPKI